MVRVIQAHNFKSQSTFDLTGDIISSKLISNDRVIIARRDGTIELRPLLKSYHNKTNFGFSNDTANCDLTIDPIHTFNAIDDLEALEYCSNGHYILTVETQNDLEYEDYTPNKVVRKSVRAYVNWDPEYTNIKSTQVRARLASRTTPTFGELERDYYEMIEIPIRSDAQPNCIGCCQLSGNIIIGLENNIIVFYKFIYRTIDKKVFIDFDEINYYVSLDYSPNFIYLTENVLITKNQYYLNAFKIMELIDISEDISEISNDDKNSHIDLSENFNAKDFELINKQLDGSIIIHGRSNVECMNKNYRNRVDIRPVQIASSSINLSSYSTASKYSLKQLINLKMDNLFIMEKKLNCENFDFIKFISLRPMYLRTRENNYYDILKFNKNSIIQCSYSEDKNDLRSRYYRDYLGCGMIVATSEDAYLYYLEKNDKNLVNGKHTLLETYAFTAPLVDIVLEDAFVYAITNVGLEIYTSKIGHHIFTNLMEENSSIIKSPKSDYPVCSIDMRPFFGLKYANILNQTLILLANVPSSDKTLSLKWTLYNLELPKPEELEMELSKKACEQLQSDEISNGYIEHLLGEAFVLIRLTKELAKIKFHEKLDKPIESLIQLTELSSTVNNEVIESFRKTCIQLGDYYVTKKDYKDYNQAASYYLMSKIGIADILERTLIRNPKSLHGLIYTLKRLIRNISRDSVELTNLMKPDGNFCTKLDQLFLLMTELAPNEISKLAMQSTVLREAMRERIYNFLLSRTDRTIEDEICLILYQIQSGAKIVKSNILIKSSEDKLFEAILPNWIIYFDTIVTKSGNRVTSFSDFTEYSINYSHNDLKILQKVFFKILLRLIIKERILKLDLIVKLITDYITLHIGLTDNCRNGQKLLKIILEKFFIDYFEFNQYHNTTTNNSVNNQNSNFDNESIENNSNIQINNNNIITSNISSPLASITSSSSSLDEIDEDLAAFKLQDIHANYVIETHRNKNLKCRHILVSLLILLRTYLDDWRKISEELKNLQFITYSDESKFFYYLNNRKKFVENNFDLNLYKSYDILCIGKRFKYLNLMKPFFYSRLQLDKNNVDGDVLATINNVEEQNELKLYEKKIKKLKIILIKIQSLLSINFSNYSNKSYFCNNQCITTTNSVSVISDDCSQNNSFITNDSNSSSGSTNDDDVNNIKKSHNYNNHLKKIFYNEIEHFLNINSNLKFYENIYLMLQTNTTNNNKILTTINLLLNYAPESIHLYCLENFSRIDEWKLCINLFLDKLFDIFYEHNVKKYNYCCDLLKELLDQLVTIKNYEEIQEILPNNESIDDILKKNFKKIQNYNDEDEKYFQKMFNDLFLEYSFKSYTRKQCEKPRLVITNTVRGQMMTMQQQNTRKEF